MGTICAVLSVIIMIIVLTVANFNDMVLNISLPYTAYAYEISLLVLSLIVFALGILGGVLLMLSSFFDKSARYSKLKKEYEKTSISALDNGDTVKILENKIKTLEAALEAALKK